MKAAKNDRRFRRTRYLLGDSRRIPMPASVIARFVASTFLMLLRWWFDEDMKHTPEPMDAMFQLLVMPAIRPILAPPDSGRIP